MSQINILKRAMIAAGLAVVTLTFLLPRTAPASSLNTPEPAPTVIETIAPAPDFPAERAMLVRKTSARTPWIPIEASSDRIVPTFKS